MEYIAIEEQVEESSIGEDSTSYEEYGNNQSGTESPSKGVLLNYSLTNTVLVGLGLLVVIFITAFGNFLVGLSLFRYRSLRTISNYLIGNLALSDFLLAITILPLSTFNECLGHWIFGRVACNLWLISDVLYCTASIWNICVIAFDRFTATFYPMWYRDKRSAKQAALYVGLVWLIASAVSVPPLLGWNDISQNFKHNNETGFDECTIFQSPSYVLFSASGSFFVPFFITFGLYVRIFGVLKERMQRSRSVRSSRRKALVQSSASIGALVGPVEKTPLCKTVTLETTIFDSPGRQSESRTRKNGEGENKEEDLELKLDPGVTTYGSEVGQFNTQQLLNDKTAGLSNELHAANRDCEIIHLSNKTPQCCDLQLDTSVGVQLTSEGGVITTDNVMLSGDPVNGKYNVSNTKSFLLSPNSLSAQRDHNPNDVNFNECQVPSESDVTLFVDDVGSIKSREGKPSGSRPIRPRTKRPGSSSSARVTPTGKKRLSRKNSVVKAFRNIGSIRSLRESITSHQQNFEQMEMKATVRMACIIAAFCCMWLGFFTLYVINGWCGVCAVPRELDAFFFWLGYLNSTVNPILYAIFNEEFRKAFKKILRFDGRRSLKGGRGSSGRSITSGGGGQSRRL